MKHKKEITKNMVEKLSKFQFLLFVFIFLFVVIKLNNNSSLNELRNEKGELKEILTNLNSLNKDYISICNLNVNEKQKVATLNSYFKYLKNNSLTDNEAILKNIIVFFQYVLNKDEKNETLICPNESSIKIKELVVFSKYLQTYRDFTNRIQQSHKSLFEEIKDTTNLNNFKYFTKKEKEKIFGGEDIFVAITGRFGDNLQKTNKLEDDFMEELSNQAKKLYYSYDDFSEITLTQITNLLNNYDNYIDKVLENKMTEKNTIPFIELSFDKSIFSKVVLIIIIFLLLLLILETIKLNKIDNLELEEYESSFNIFIFLHKKLKKRYYTLEKVFIYIWSVFFLIIPIIVIFIFFNNSPYSKVEIFLVSIFLILYYFWTFFINKSFKNR